MNRSRLLTATAALGIFVGALGIGVATTQALAAVSPGPASPVATDAQATPEATPGPYCPFANADGTFDLDAMHEYMDSIHGEGWFEQMWARMTGDATAPADGTGFGPGTGICPFGTGTGFGPGTGPATAPGTGWQGGMMGRFGIGAQ